MSVDSKSFKDGGGEAAAVPVQDQDEMQLVIARTSLGDGTYEKYSWFNGNVQVVTNGMAAGIRLLPVASIQEGLLRASRLERDPGCRTIEIIPPEPEQRLYLRREASQCHRSLFRPIWDYPLLHC